MIDKQTRKSIYRVERLRGFNEEDVQRHSKCYCCNYPAECSTPAKDDDGTIYYRPCCRAHKDQSPNFQTPPNTGPIDPSFSDPKWSGLFAG